MLILLVAAFLVLTGKWDYVLALVIGLVVLNLCDRFRSRRGS